MAKVYMDGLPVSGTASYASNVNCLGKDGNQSTVQAELDSLDEKINEQNKNLNMRYNPVTDMVEIFYDGVWHTWKQGNMQNLYAYYYGDENIAITGGWSPYAYMHSGGGGALKAPTITRETNRMKLSLTGKSGSDYTGGTVFINTPIDVTNYSNLEAVVSNVSGVASGIAGTTLYMAKAKENQFPNYGGLAPSANGTHYASCSNITGEVYLAFSFWVKGTNSISLDVESVAFLK